MKILGSDQVLRIEELLKDKVLPEDLYWKFKVTKNVCIPDLARTNHPRALKWSEALLHHLPFLKYSHTIGYDFNKRKPYKSYSELSLRERKRREDLTFRVSVDGKSETMYLTCPICGLKGSHDNESFYIKII